jgi:hypothetical protein
MRLASIGGLLVTVASVLFLAALPVGVSGGAVSGAGAGPGGLLVTVGLAMLAGGAVLLCVTGPGALGGRVPRVGLSLVGIGIAANLATSNVSASSMLVLVFLAGGMVAGLGAVITILGLLAAQGLPRRIALTFLGGLVLAGAAGVLTNMVVDGSGVSTSIGRVLITGLALAGGVAMAVALAGVGIHGMRPNDPIASVIGR